MQVLATAFLHPSIRIARLSLLFIDYVNHFLLLK